MNFGRVSKAIAGAVVSGVAVTGTTLVTVPDTAGMPWWGHVLVGVVNAAIVYAGVYFAPRNTQ